VEAALSSNYQIAFDPFAQPYNSFAILKYSTVDIRKYHSVNASSFSKSQSDHIKQLPL